MGPAKRASGSVGAVRQGLGTGAVFRPGHFAPGYSSYRLPQSVVARTERRAYRRSRVSDAKTPADLEKYKGRLKGAIVLSAPIRDLPAHFTSPGSRYTDEDLQRMEEATAEPGGVRAAGAAVEQAARVAVLGAPGAPNGGEPGGAPPAGGPPERCPGGPGGPGGGPGGQAFTALASRPRLPLKNCNFVWMRAR